MQEEITQGAIAISVETSKMTASLLQKAMTTVLDKTKNIKGQFHHEKQTMRQLMKHNTSVSNIEFTD